MKRIYNFNNFKLLEKEDIGSTKYINLKFVTMMNELYKSINDLIMPDLSTNFDINYIKGEKITISTGNDNDLSFEVNRKDDQLSIKVKPLHGIDYEYSFSVSQNGIETVFETIESEVSKTTNKGLFVKSVNLKDYNNKLEKAPRVRRSLKIDYIKLVLENAVKNDEIDLKGIDVDELIKRMKLK